MRLRSVPSLSQGMPKAKCKLHPLRLRPPGKGWRQIHKIILPPRWVAHRAQVRLLLPPPPCFARKSIREGFRCSWKIARNSVFFLHGRTEKKCTAMEESVFRYAALLILFLSCPVHSHHYRRTSYARSLLIWQILLPWFQRVLVILCLSLPPRVYFGVAYMILDTYT